jgi:hypothetical protein
MSSRARGLQAVAVMALTLTTAVSAAEKPRLFGGHSEKPAATERRAAPAASGFKFDPARVEQLTGFKGKVYQDAEPVFKIIMPREDLNITISGLPLTGFMAPNSWIGLQQLTSGNIMLMGDLVLHPDEVNPVMDVLLKNRIEVTALNSQYLHDDPHVLFMHIAGADSNVENLAISVRKAFDEIKRIRGSQQLTASAIEPAFATSAIEARKLDDILKTRGQTQDGMYKAVFGRQSKMPCGCPVGENMGINTWAAFAGTNANAIATGQIAAVDGELQTTLKSLRENNINVVAIHNAMENEVPRVIFVNFWARGNAEDLAQALRDTLDKQKTAKAKE